MQPSKPDVGVLESRSFYLFRNKLAVNYKRLLMYSVYTAISKSQGSNPERLAIDVREHGFSETDINDAVQALAHKKGVMGVAVIRIQKQKPTYRIRNSESIKAWLRYMETTHSELVALVKD